MTVSTMNPILHSGRFSEIGGKLMRLRKFNSYHLEKCYAVNEIEVDGCQHFVIAAEKQDACLVFSLAGEFEDKVWEGPSGTMSIVPLRGHDGEFLATKAFYSPNDSKDARIVYAKYTDSGWNVRDLVEIPFVHRFDVIDDGNKRYIIAATIKGAHEYKDDWRTGGSVYMAMLPEDIDSFLNSGKQVKFDCILPDIHHNHGYFRIDGNSFAIAGDEGIFVIKIENGIADVRWIIDSSASDIAFADIDDDGESEIIVISPFHGNHISIFKKIEDRYKSIFEYDRELPFSHAIAVARYADKSVFLIGNRGGDREIVVFGLGDDGNIQHDVLETGLGSANFYVTENNDKSILVATNREIDEIDFYYIE